MIQWVSVTYFVLTIPSVRTLKSLQNGNHFKLALVISSLVWGTWGSILQQYLDKVTLVLSKGRFVTRVFLGLGIHEAKVQFPNFLLEF